MSLNDAQLRFRATLEDDVSPQITKLEQKLKQMGASPAEAKMFLRAYDEATPKIKEAQKQLNMLPKEHIISISAATQGARDHMRMVKQEFKEPIEVPINFVDNLDQVGERLFTMKTRLAGPISGLVPGTSMLYGVGAGAGILGAVSGITAYLKKSIDINSELEQQHAQLTQALKDSGAATEEMTRLLKMSTSSQFSRSDLTQADITARQFNIPSFANQSRYMPSGALPIAENLAAAGQTSVTQATDAIARATQGYYRGLLPYGISMRQEDFGTGGRFAGKTPEQAIEQAARRFSGAAEEQGKTFQGMIQRFKNVFEDKIITPLGAFAFSGTKSVLGSALGGLDSQSTQNRIGHWMAEAQDQLAKFWILVQKGAAYFNANLKKPIEDTISAIVKLGAAFTKGFGGTFTTIVQTLGTALLAIAKPLAEIAANHQGLVEVYGVLKALSVIGFGNISQGLVAPLKDLGGHPIKFVQDMLKLPGVLAKIGGALIIKGFLDAHTATQGLNNEFPKLKDHMGDVNWQIDKMANKLGQSTVKMKELVSEAASLMSGPMSDAQKFDLSKRVAQAGGQLNLSLGVDATQAGIMIAKAVQASKDYSTAQVSKFENELGGATSAAKALGYSFSDLTRVMTQYATVAPGAGLGGIRGAGGLFALQAGADSLHKGNPNELVQSLLKLYGDPSAQDLSRLNLRNSFGFHRNPQALGTFVMDQTNLFEQSRTADASNRQMQTRINRLAPGIRVPTVPNPLDSLLPNINRIMNAGSSTNTAEEVNRQLQATSKATNDVSDHIQRLTASISTLDSRQQEYAQAQSQVNLKLEAFNDSLVPTQRHIEDIQLSMATLQQNAITPLNREITRLNETISENSNTQSNAQYVLDKYTQGLMTGEQAALNHTHALQMMNEQLQILQLSYQTIGAELGSQIYDQGASVRVNPMSNFTLAMQQQKNERRMQLDQLKYETTFGEQHYKLEQAARSKRQREELPFAARMKEVNKLTPVIDNTTEKSHALGQEQFILNKRMFSLNETMQNQQDAANALQLQLQKLNDSKQLRHLQDDQRHLTRATNETAVAQARLQTKLGVYQNIYDSIKGKLKDLGGLFKALRDDTSSNPFTQDRRILRVALEAHLISAPEFQKMMSKVSEAQDSYNKAVKKGSWMSSQESWITIIRKGVFGLFTGNTERQAVDGIRSVAGHIPVVGHTVSNLLGGGLGSVLAAAVTAYLGISTARAALRTSRYALFRGGSRVLSRIAPETHIAEHVGQIAQDFPRFGTQSRLNRALKSLQVLEETAPGSQKFYEAAVRVDKLTHKIGEQNKVIEKNDLVALGDKIGGSFKEGISSSFRWFHTLREHGNEAVFGTLFAAIGSAIAGPGPGTILGGLLGRRIGARRAEERTIRADAKAAAGVITEAAKIMHDPAKAMREAAKSAKESAKETADRVREDVKTATKMHDASSSSHTAARESAKAAGKSKGAIDNFAERVQKFGEHIRGEGKIIGIFAGAVAAFAVLIKTFGSVFHGIEDLLHIHTPKDSPKSTPHRTVTPNEGGHADLPAGFKRDSAGRIRRMDGRYASAAEVEKAASHVGPLARIFRFGGHAMNADFGVSNVTGALSGDPLSDAYIGTSAVNQLRRAVARRIAHGTLPSAIRNAAADAAGKSSEDIGAKGITKFLAKRIAGTGLGLVGGALALPLDAYFGAQFMDQLFGSPGRGRPAPNIRDLQAVRRGIGMADPRIPGSGSAGVGGTLLQDYLNKHPDIVNGNRGNLSPDEAMALKQNEAAQSKIAEMLNNANIPLTKKQYQQYQRDLQNLQSTYDRQFKDATQSSHDDIYKMEQDQQTKVVKTETDSQTLRLNNTNAFHKSIADATNGGMSKVTSIAQKWLKQQDALLGNQAAKWGVSLAGTGDITAGQGGTGAGSASQSSDGRRFAAGGFAGNVIRGRGDSRGYLARVGEEGDELIVPLAPHRRDRARSLLRQASGIVGSFANGGYVNPFAHAQANASIVDMGVDAGGTGPIGAIGRAKILNVGSQGSGTGAGQWIAYQLLSGARKNAIVYVAEGIKSLVRGGEIVKAGQPIADFAGGIETGWAHSGTVWDTMAKALGEVPPGVDPGVSHYSTAAGADFNRFIGGLGAPMGSLGAGGAHGSLRALRSALGGLSPQTAGGGSGGVGGMTISALVPNMLKKRGMAGVLMYKALSRLKHLVNTGGGASDQAGQYHGPLNRLFPPHLTGTPGATLSRKQIGSLLAKAGLPSWFVDIARGESSYEPGVQQRDRGDGKVGYGLFQITPNAWGAGSAAMKFLNSLGGISQMFNPWKNTEMAKFLYDHAASKIPNHIGFPWYGTKYLRGYAGGKTVNNDQELALLHRGEKVLTAAQAAAGEPKGSKMLSKVLELHDDIKKMVKALKEINDKTPDGTKKHTADLRQINSDLRKSWQNVAHTNSHATKAIRDSLKAAGDKSGGEDTLAGVTVAKHAIMTMQNHDRRHDRQLVHHTTQMHHEAKNLLKKAHTTHQKTLVHTAMRKTGAASKAARKVTSFTHGRKGSAAEKSIATMKTVVKDAQKGISASLLKAITGKALTGKSKKDYEAAAKAKDGSKAQQKAATQLRKDLTKGLSANAKHLQNLRAEAKTQSAKAQRALSAAKTAVSKTEGAVKKADDHSVKAKAASDKRDEDYQKKSLELLTTLAKKDTVVNIHNTAKGASLDSKVKGKSKTR